MLGVQRRRVQAARRRLGRFYRGLRIAWQNRGMPSTAPRYLFHHIPKCAGTSAVEAFSQWFQCIEDYPPPWADEDHPELYRKYCASPRNISRLRPYQMLTGHWHVPGSYLHERYPECLTDPRFRLVSFIRDPLEVQISLYNYERRKSRSHHDASFEDILLSRPNYISQRFPCDLSNYREVIDRYYFVGFVEDYQRSFDVFARMAAKPPITLPHLNTSARTTTTLSSSFESEFREVNRLDYLIYEYCRNRFAV